jgi:hypothetical protein
MEYVATQPVNLPLADFLELEFYLLDNRPGVKPAAFVAELVKRWRAVENERLALRRDGPAMRGFISIGRTQIGTVRQEQVFPLSPQCKQFQLHG